MSAPGLKMVAHLGESGRVGGRSAVDVVADLAAGAGVHAAVVLRGVEGFGAHHRLMTDRLLSLSEDLPIVVVAVGHGEPVRGLASAVGAILPSGVVTLERIAIVGEAMPDATAPGAEAKLVVHCGRAEAPEVADALREAGLAGAIALNGVDGALRGRRHRARLWGRNRDVPGMVVAVGAARQAVAAARRIDGVAGAHVMTLERVGILRRDGVAVGPLPTPSSGSEDLWQRVVVTAGEADGEGARPLHLSLIRALRAAGAPGATALRGVRGHTGADAVHADRLLAVRRRAPVLVTIIAGPAEMARLWPAIEDATRRTGLVTCELVPRVHAASAAHRVQAQSVRSSEAGRSSGSGTSWGGRASVSDQSA